MNNFDLGDKVRVSGTFRDTTGALIDPAVVKFQYRPETIGTVTTLTYGTDAALVKDSTGTYHVDLDTSTATGRWYWRLYSTGSGQSAAEDVFYVRTSQLVTTPVTAGLPMIHSSYTPTVYENRNGGSINPLSVVSGSVGVQDYSTYGPWLQLSLRLGPFQISTANVAAIFVSLPTGYRTTFNKSITAFSWPSLLPNASGQGGPAILNFQAMQYFLITTTSIAGIPDGDYIYLYNPAGFLSTGSDLTIYTEPVLTIM